MKTHITSQEENIDEQGIQIRESDPSSPIDKTFWINTTEKRLKYFANNQKVTISEGESLDNSSSTNLDVESFTHFYREITANTQFTVQNVFAGFNRTLLVKNTDTTSHTITFSNNDVFIDNSATLTISPNQVMALNIISSIDALFISFEIYNP